MKMCPHCGWQYDPADKRYSADTSAYELVPYHDECPPLRACCPGSKQHPRNPETDRRPLWRDLPPPLTPEQAQKAYDDAEPVPLSEERVQEIVDYATSGGQPTPHSAAIDALLKEAGDGRHCLKCGGLMYHSRLKGYQCNRC